MRHLTLFLGLTLASALGACQKAHPPEDHDHGPATTMAGGGTLPAGWSARPDDGGTMAEVKVEEMAPGWHVTMATSAIIYRPADQASGGYTYSAKLHLFPEGAGHREALGIFVGGADLEGSGQRYTYFLIRGDGTWRIKRRQGAQTTDVTPGWTASPAIVKGKPDDSVANTLSVTVKDGTASFAVNGTEVYSAATSAVDVDGTVGLRINHNLSVHVESVTVTPG